MARWFNLIVTHLPGSPAKREAIMELRRLLRDEVDIVATAPNIIFARSRDPDDAISRIRGGIGEDTVILRVIPVYRVVDPNIEAVKSAVDDLLLQADPGSFAVKVDGYLRDVDGSLMHRRDAAVKIAEGVDRPVNLSNPDILVYVKVVKIRGRYSAAIFVGPPSMILSTTKLRG
ncbi:MAG: THUMP domain-containing protein [Desulfurococcales archaeon]|nr:THUMP domain-containing protein [Desulfurococcales archaeon]MCE4605244.1 THUMP domain-containing protein [Desulfurococcales archaeon]